MRYLATDEDKRLLVSNGSINYKIKIEITTKNRTIVDVLYGVSSFGSGNIDSDSNIRRTINLTLKLDDFVSGIENKIANWMGLFYEVNIGIYDLKNDEYKYYPFGRFKITSASTVYNATTNSITFDLSDRMSELDGTRNGQQGGAQTISIPKQDDEGNKSTIRGSTINLITSSTDIDKYIIDDIGEYYGMPQNSANYEDYRKNHDEWNVLPYDLEFSSGSYMSDILFEIRDLYPSCQMYFDIYDNFCFDMIPTLENDEPDMDDSFISKVLLADSSESVTYDIGNIKNVNEVFGKTYDIDYFSNSSAAYLNDTYIVNVDTIVQDDGVMTESSVYIAYEKYDKIAFTCPTACSNAPKININSLGDIPIYYQYTTDPICAGEIQAGDVCVIEIYFTMDSDNQKVFCAYYLGEYQPHAICVLTADKNDTQYTSSYFAHKYNTKERNVIFREAPFSPFTVQKMGEIFDTQDVEEITSDSVCRDNAKYNNYKSSTMFDTVTLNTVLIPWLDVNVKVNYTKLQEKTTYSYIIKSVSHDFSSCTSTITMYRFQQLYE